MNEQSRLGPSLFESLWRYRVLVVGIPLILGVLGYLLSAQQPESYDASAVLFLKNPTTTPGIENDTFSGLDRDAYVPEQAARASSRTVLVMAQERLDDPPSVTELREMLAVQSDISNLGLTILASGPTGQRAADIANAVATAYQDLNSQIEEEAAEDAVANFQPEIESLESELAALQSQLEGDPTANLAITTRIQTVASQLSELNALVNDIERDAEILGSRVDIFEPAEVPEEPARPQPALFAVIFAFFGAVCTAMWAYWWAGKSQRVLSRGEPEAVLGVPLLGEIPVYRITSDDRLTGLLRVDPAAAEAYEFVLSSIEFALADIGGSSLMVTSTLPGDGKTTTSLQLAIAASRDRRRVVLVDADIRARGLTNVLGAKDRMGLSDLAAMDLEPTDVMRRYRFSEQSQIPVVTAGQRRGDPAALLRTSSFRRAVASLDEAAELLLVDSSPLLAVADATIVAGSCDGMVIVVSHGTPVSELEKVRERLKFVSTPLLGYIFNRSDSSTAGAYGYGYGVAEDADGERRLLPRDAAQEVENRRRARRERRSGAADDDVTGAPQEDQDDPFAGADADAEARAEADAEDRVS